ncbi:DUF7916 family protein [Salirhabdus salicampi]|uniref:DUF7916 family protein n=1 Tax=Salirhabdus salicampi TaxID=476102 RepID=UPI0020C4606A|nr:haloacid dehalogenase-like hydrolase [Salirhabdus salicampi]MCP8617810.1 haloacid dehalogenase-like hydrolase [Salirhabdus salicampi]
MKRILNCFASDFKGANKQDLLQSISASEGRTVLAEIVSTASPLYPEVSNPEIVSAFGADLILLNLFDVNHPAVAGIQAEEGQVINRLKELTGRPIGLNLEPVDREADAAEILDQLPLGRQASYDSLHKAKTLGFDFVCLTGNPKTGVTNEQIEKAIQRTKEILGEEAFIIAGKMHGAGVKGEAGNEIIDDETIEAFIQAGADVILLPSPGTVPGITVDQAHCWVSKVHQLQAQAMLTIGTSQEGADNGTVRHIALQNKMIGADIHHIGDAGYTGIAIPENIMDYSIAIRGKRHTYVRMAASINR